LENFIILYISVCRWGKFHFPWSKNWCKICKNGSNIISTI